MDIDSVIQMLTDAGVAVVLISGALLLLAVTLKAHLWLKSLFADNPRSAYPELYDPLNKDDVAVRKSIRRHNDKWGI